MDGGGPELVEGARAGARETTSAAIGVMTWRRGAEAIGRGVGADVENSGFAGRSSDFSERPSRFDDE
jgi:hypothetical protein